MSYKSELNWGTGRRKTAVAQVSIKPGKGEITINKRKFEEYFPLKQHRNRIMSPLTLTKRDDKYDIFVRVRGGGIAAQAGAIRHGIARALSHAEEGLTKQLKDKYFLTRDPRMKERKKYGKRGARRGQQYSKR